MQLKSNIFSKSAASGEIFKDERVLYSEFVPEELPFRETQINELVFSFKPVMTGLKPSSLLVFGSTGTGKTVTVKFVLKQLSEASDRAKSLHVNCFEYNSRQAVLAQIASFLGFPVPRRGIGADEAYSKILEGLKKCNFVPIIVFDEADQLLNNGELNKLLYDLLRANEHSVQKNFFGVVLISNNQNLRAMLDDRTRSSFASDTIAFSRYSPVQLKEILGKRAELAFFPRALEKEIINVAAAHAAKLGGDARIAIESLLKAGKAAEKEGSSMVKLGHLRIAFDSIDYGFGRKKLLHLNEHQKIVLKILLEKEQVFSGELFKEFLKNSKTNLTQRHFRGIVSQLEKDRVIKSQSIEKGIRGKTKQFSLSVPKELAMEAINEK